MSRFTPILILALLLLGSVTYAATTPPTEQAVQHSLDTLAERKLSDSERQAVQQTLERTLRLINEREETLAQTQALQKQVEQAPQQIERARQQLANLQAKAQHDADLGAGERTVQALEQELLERSHQLSEWQQAMLDANALVISAQTRPERTQRDIGAIQTRTQQINTALKNERLDDQPLTPELRGQLNAELALLEAQAHLRRQELAANSRLLDLGTSRRELLQTQIEHGERERVALQEQINALRRAESQQTVNEQAQQARRSSAGGLVAEESALNLKFSDYLLEVTERLNLRTQQNLDVRQRLDSLNQTSQTLDQQINVLGDNLLLSRILNQQKHALPNVQVDRDNLKTEIADLRLYQFELNQRREAIAQPERYLNELLEEQPAGEASDSLRQALRSQVETRRELLERLSDQLNALLSESISLQLNRQELADTSASLLATLNERLFWLPSNRPVDLQWLGHAPQRIGEQLLAIEWQSAVTDIVSGLAEHPWVFLPLLMLIGLLLWKRRFLQTRLREINGQVGHYRNDSQLHTPLALLFNLLLALPGTLFLLLCSYALGEDARGHNAALSDALFSVAQAWLLFYTLYRLTRPRGMAEVHFRWSHAAALFMRRRIAYLGAVVMALLVVVSVAEHQPANLADDSLGLLVVVVCFGLISWLTLSMVLNNPQWADVSTLRRLAAVACCLLPLVLIVAVLFGYYYTALKLTARLIDTLYLMLIWLVIEASVVRGLAVAARRLAFARAQAQRQAEAEQRGSEAEAIIEAPNLDIDQVSAQSLRLVRLTLFSLFLVALYGVWAELIGVFTYLDTITLYEYTSEAGLQPITLLDLLSAVVIAGLTVVLAGNIPGLLEVLVLSRLKLAQGSAYATTTLLSYLLISVGVVATLGTLGVSWDKLQWLVAALSVGLGFGLQAIFANFVSGLIILFERPVRIGDLVTIGGVTGTVKRIHIRATHIIDSDRKAVIVPNQTFITTQLINWTLLDSITRLVLTFSVNRGADLNEVTALLLKAATDNHRVMRDPAPSAQLVTYGASALTYELKVYVRELGDRGPATDELNRAVDALFVEHGINLSSVPKMDVFLQSRDGKAQQRIEPPAEPDPAPGA